MSRAIPQSVYTDCRKHSKSGIDFNNFNTFNNVEEKGNKTALEQKLKDNVDAVLELCSDKAKAKELLLDIVSTKGQIDVEPIELDCGKKVDEYLGKNFRITKTDKGMHFHEFGGYSVFARWNIISLCSTLEFMMDTLRDIETEESDKFSQEEIETTTATLSAMTMCLKSPQVAACDVDFMFKLATDITKLLLKWQDKAQSAELREDNPEDLEAVRETINQFS